MSLAQRPWNLRGRCGSWLAGDHRRSRCHTPRRL